MADVAMCTGRLEAGQLCTDCWRRIAQPSDDEQAWIQPPARLAHGQWECACRIVQPEAHEEVARRSGAPLVRAGVGLKATGTISLD